MREDLTYLTKSVKDWHIPRDRICPPPTQSGVEHQPDQDSESQYALDHHDEVDSTDISMPKSLGT
jgi:hypothetical protein